MNVRRVVTGKVGGKSKDRIGRRYAPKPGVQKYSGPVGGSALVDVGGAYRARRWRRHHFGEE